MSGRYTEYRINSVHWHIYKAEGGEKDGSLYFPIRRTKNPFPKHERDSIQCTNVCADLPVKEL